MRIGRKKNDRNYIKLCPRTFSHEIVSKFSIIVLKFQKIDYEGRAIQKQILNSHIHYTGCV